MPPESKCTCVEGQPKCTYCDPPHCGKCGKELSKLEATAGDICTSCRCVKYGDPLPDLPPPSDEWVKFW